MMTQSMIGKRIIFEDKDIIVLHKPADLAVQTARLGEKDAVSEVKNYLAGSEKKESYLGIIHRLDQPVEGLLVFAKNKESAAGLSRQITDHTFLRFYCGLVMGVPEQKEGELRSFLQQDKQRNRSYVVPAVRKTLSDAGLTEEAKEGVLQYKVLKEEKDIALLEVKLITGRHHQIRVQMSQAGMPLIGDQKYGNAASAEKSIQMGCLDIALCAWRLEFIHPGRSKKMSFTIKPDNKVFLSFFTNF